MTKDGTITFDNSEESYWWEHYIILPRNDEVAQEDPKFQKEFHL